MLAPHSCPTAHQLTHTRTDAVRAVPCPLPRRPARLVVPVGSEHVRLISVEEARALYQAQCERGNAHHTVLVAYAPWCHHCREMEDEVGTAHDTLR